MKCIICKKNFNFKKTFKNFLDNDNEQVCDDCYNKYPIKISFDVLPVNQHMVHIFSLFPKKYRVPEQAFIKEYSRLFDYVYQKNNKEVILMLKGFNLTKTFFPVLELISTLFDSDIYIICNYIED